MNSSVFCVIWGERAVRVRSGGRAGLFVFVVFGLG